MYLQMSAHASPASVIAAANSIAHVIAIGAGRARTAEQARGIRTGANASRGMHRVYVRTARQAKRGGPRGPPLPCDGECARCDDQRLKYMSYSMGCVVIRKR